MDFCSYDVTAFSTWGMQVNGEKVVGQSIEIVDVAHTSSGIDQIFSI
jgi:hypothetical protein